MFETKGVGDNFNMLLTALANLVTNIHYRFTLASANIPKMSPTSQNRHQDVANTTVTQFLNPCTEDFEQATLLPLIEINSSPTEMPFLPAIEPLVTSSDQI